MLSGVDMSADDKRNEQVEDNIEAADAAATEQQDLNDQAESGEGSELDTLRAQVQEYQDQALRAQAEMQNVRLRAEVDVEKDHNVALDKIVNDLLPEEDSLERVVVRA